MSVHSHLGWPCEPLCATLPGESGTDTGQGCEGGFGPVSEELARTKVEAVGYSRRKPWRFPCARATTTARSAGGFRNRELTLLWWMKTAIDAVFGKNRKKPRNSGISNGADFRKGGFEP